MRPTAKANGGSRRRPARYQEKDSALRGRGAGVCPYTGLIGRGVGDRIALARYVLSGRAQSGHEKEGRFPGLCHRPLIHKETDRSQLFSLARAPDLVGPDVRIGASAPR